MKPARAVQASGGRKVRGEPVEALDPVVLRRSVGYVRQDNGLVPHWACLTNASLVPSLLAEPDVEDRPASSRRPRRPPPKRARPR